MVGGAGVGDRPHPTGSAPSPPFRAAGARDGARAEATTTEGSSPDDGLVQEGGPQVAVPAGREPRGGRSGIVGDADRAAAFGAGGEDAIADGGVADEEAAGEHGRAGRGESVVSP